MKLAINPALTLFSYWLFSMFKEVEDESLVEKIPLPIQEIPEDRALTETVLLPTNLSVKLSKPQIRTSLRALTLESVFAAVFYTIIGSALLSNFLLELGAGPLEIGLLASIPPNLGLLLLRLAQVET